MNIQIERLSDPADPRVAEFHSLKGDAGRLASSSMMVVEGVQQLERALLTLPPADKLFLESTLVPRFENLFIANESRLIIEAPRDVMERIIGYRMHNGAFGIFRRPEDVPLSELKPPIVALNKITDPMNVGSIARNCAAFGVESVLIDDETADLFQRRAIRISMGSVFGLKVCRVPQLGEALRELPMSITKIAVEQGTAAESFGNGALGRDTLLLFGNEREGIQPELLEACDRILEIPMERSLITSLNVNAASAIVLSILYASAEKVSGR
jgi:tRNA G18 (ribose-2'-O)-methylase SpoU